MRIRPRCPGLLHGNLLHTMSTNGHVKVLLSVLLILAAIIVMAITIMETRSSWLHRDATLEHDQHPLARKKFSVAIATDVSNMELRYGVVIDCGSSGSRVYVYFWPPHNGNARELLNIQHMRDTEGAQVVKKITPGLSAYEDKPAEASDYLRPLLQYAASHVPAHKHAETPLYIMATAGLRMLPESAQSAIMADLRVDISMEFKFMFVETHAEVITGKQEGVYAWIAINYVLGKFDHSIGYEDPVGVVEVPGQDHATHFRKRTTGIIDMGGGSMQIAYEVPRSEDLAKTMLAEFNLGCTASDFDHTYRVYVSTFLGFGANTARERYERHLLATAGVGVSRAGNATDSFLGRSATVPLPDPCLPFGMTESVVHGGTNYYLRGTGDYEGCLDRAQPLLNATGPCIKDPCSINGIYQPKIDFRNSEFYGFSEFYYTMEDIFDIGGKYKYLKFHQAAKEYCSRKWTDLQELYEKKRYPRADYNRYRYQCFKSAWMSRVLHEGLHFPKVYPYFTSLQLIDGKEVHWTLGALLYKTRYFPLSAIQQRVARPHRGSWGSMLQQSPTAVILVCFLVVGAAILIYLRRLRIVRRPDLRKVPSMAYFMTDEGQIEEGISVLNVMP